MSSNKIELGIFFLDALYYQKLTLDGSIPCKALIHTLQGEMEGTRVGPILDVFAVCGTLPENALEDLPS